MEAIWKYVLDRQSRGREGQVITMPLCARVLDVQMQGCRAVLWALVNADPNARMEERRFILVGTGEERDRFGAYHGTLQDGATIYHLFEIFGEGPF